MYAHASVIFGAFKYRIATVRTVTTALIDGLDRRAFGLFLISSHTGAIVAFSLSPCRGGNAILHVRTPATEGGVWLSVKLNVTSTLLLTR